jgi:hypothetical protein
VLRETWRVVQLAVGPAGKPDTFGSGYLVCTGLVLTAAHVVDGRSPAECSVRLPYSPDRHRRTCGVREIWSGTPDSDLAVLTLVDPPVYANRTPFGRLTRATDELVAVTAGFPRWRRRRPEEGTPTFRDLSAVRGRLKLITLDTRAGLEFVLDDQLPEPDENGAWGGMSGASVWVGNRIVAVVIENHRSEGAGWLVVQPVHDLYRSVNSEAGAKAVRALGLPRSLDDLQPTGGDRTASAGRPDVTAIVRYVLESDFLPSTVLVEGGSYRMGRHRNNTVVVDRDGVSGRHCTISVDPVGTPPGHAVHIRDVDSTNGTFVNGERLRTYVMRRLIDGDEISLGHVAVFCLRSVG